MSGSPSLIGRVGFGALLLALFLAPAIGGYPGGGVYGADVSLNALRALVILAATCLLGSSPPDLLRPGRAATVAVGRAAVWLLFAWALLSLLVHSRFLTSPVLLFAELPGTLNWLCYALVATLCAMQARDDMGKTRFLLGALLAGAAFSAASGAWDYVRAVQAGDRAARVFGPFFDPNFLAGLLALGLPLAVAYCFAVQKRPAAAGFAALGGLLAGALAATGSRGGFAIGLAGAGVSVALIAATAGFRARSARMVLVGAAILVSTALFRAPLTARVGSGSPSQEHSGAFRVYTWKGALRMAAAQPLLGAGPGTFPYLYAPYALVEKTGLAHSSYLETAAEIGFPGLALAAGCLAAALVSGLSQVLRRHSATDEPDAAAARLLLCGIVGALAVGCVRSLLDSEWAIMGNGIPFWAIVGLALAGTPKSSRADNEASANETVAHERPRDRRPVVGALLLLSALGLTLLLLKNAELHDAAQATVGRRETPPRVAVWPPDPDLLAWSGDPAGAARVEPTGARYYRLGRAAEIPTGQMDDPVAAFRESVRRDPNNFQGWRALAEAQERTGDTDGALAAWRELIRRYEGPAGQIRAVPELPETYPAFAYASVGRALELKGDVSGARANYEKAAEVVEAYSRTPVAYQRTELAAAQRNGADILGRRTELRDLYVGVSSKLLTRAPTDTIARGGRQRQTEETLRRLDALLKPSGPGLSGTP